MALITGSALGTITQQEDLYVEGAPTIFFQDYDAGPMFNPDGNGYYWQLSGTATYPVYEIGCVTDVSLSEDITINDVLCDNVGVKSSIQQRNYVEFNFSIQSFFPLSVLTYLLKGGTATEAAPTEFFEMGQIDNSQYWAVWCPKVYDTSVGDYLGIQLHKAQFVEPFTVDMAFGTPWTATGLRLRAFIDTTKTPDQFVTWVRSDASVIT
ncbi:MAG: hypothetical protein ACXADH_18950 [Candidatus Kariarchaeaceae archaeon]|jgi:hypothetical protein